MNRIAHSALVFLMMGILFIVFAIAVAPAVKDFTDIYRGNSTDNLVTLDCGNSSISDYDKGACVITDFNQAYIILGVIGLGIFLITAWAVSGR